jgi:hypothetical protein
LRVKKQPTWWEIYLKFYIWQEHIRKLTQ